MKEQATQKAMIQVKFPNGEVRGKVLHETNIKRQPRWRSKAGSVQKQR